MLLLLKLIKRERGEGQTQTKRETDILKDRHTERQTYRRKERDREIERGGLCFFSMRQKLVVHKSIYLKSLFEKIKVNKRILNIEI